MYSQPNDRFGTPISYFRGPRINHGPGDWLFRLNVFAFLLSPSILVMGGYLKLEHDVCFFSRYLQFSLH